MFVRCRLIFPTHNSGTIPREIVPILVLFIKCSNYRRKIRTILLLFWYKYIDTIVFTEVKKHVRPLIPFIVIFHKNIELSCPLA